MNELNCQLPKDLLNHWTQYDDPYNGRFNLQMLYQDMYSIINKYPQNVDFIRLASKGLRYGCPEDQRQATYDAAKLHNLLSTHSELLSNWISTQSKLDAIIRTDIPGNVDTFKVRGVMEDVLSLSLAGRVPVVICDSFTSKEVDNNGYGVWTNLNMPRTMLDFMKYLRPLCETGRCIVLPEVVSVDTCLIDQDSSVSLSHRILPSIEDIFKPKRTFSLQHKNEDNRIMELIVPRPIFKYDASFSKSPMIVYEHAENYTMYQAIISTLCKKLRDANSETDIQIAFLEFEAGIAKVEIEYKKLMRDLQFKGIATTFSLAATVLCVLVPDIAAMVAYLTGSTTLWNGIEVIRSIDNIDNDLKTSPYWLPWYSRHLDSLS